MKIAYGFCRLTALVLALLTLMIGFPAYAEEPTDPGYPFPWRSIPPQKDARPVPFFIGHEATPQPIDALEIPANPYMAAGSWSAFHGDTYMSDTYPVPGPLGKSPEVSSVLLANAWGASATGTILFPKDGWVLGLVNRPDPDGVNMRAWLTLFHPDTLEPLAWMPLPPEPKTALTNNSVALPAGAYAYLDEQDRAVVGTAGHTIWVVSHECTGLTCTLTKEREYDLTGVINADDDFQAVQPDFTGRLWFATKGGVVGIMNMTTGMVLGTVTLAGEKIENATAIDETGGVFLDSTEAVYRFDFDPDADEDGEPSITWREPYDNGTHVKVLSRGSGTTPTLMGTEYVIIADNADPQIHVLVYRRAKVVEGPRLVCAVPVFKPGQSNCENSLIATDKSIVVENNFGYRGINSTENGRTTKPGIARINVDENGCHIEWTNWEETVAAGATEKMSLTNGLIYAYTKSKGPANTDAWYFTAIDFYSGKVVYKVLAGTGTLFNDHVLGIYVGRNGALYQGVLGGLVSMRDGQ